MKSWHATSLRCCDSKVAYMHLILWWHEANPILVITNQTSATPPPPPHNIYSISGWHYVFDWASIQSGLSQPWASNVESPQLMKMWDVLYPYPSSGVYLSIKNIPPKRTDVAPNCTEWSKTLEQNTETIPKKLLHSIRIQSEDHWKNDTCVREKTVWQMNN